MSKTLNEKNILKIFISLLVSAIILFLSFDNLIWAKLWGSLKIPPNVIPFSDFKAHLIFLECMKSGVDIFNEKCDLIPDGNSKLTTHPKIWVYFFEIFKLDNVLIYNFSIFFLLFVYLLILSNFLDEFNNVQKIFLIFLYFSTTNFIMIERLATDLIIFILVYFILISNSKLIQSILIYFGFILKYYPIFLISIFSNNKKYLIFFIFFITIIILFFSNNLLQVNSNLVEMALPIAYGSRTMLSAFYHLSKEFNLFLNDNNLNFYRILIMVCFGVYSFLLIITGYLNTQKFRLENKFNKFFIGGASIFLGTFIVGSNADYRLVFLLFTLPLIFDLKNLFIKYSLLFSYFFIFNSFYFLIGDKLSIIFFISSSINFIIKISAFSLISLIFGSQLKQIDFFKIKF